MDTKEKNKLLDNFMKPKMSFSKSTSKGHTIMPKSDGKQLIVGKNIKLNGAIDVCESLVVEGTLEANLNGAKYLDIVYGGTFTGNAEVEEAHISGVFDGNLTVSNILYVYETGEIRGKINYTNLIVEKGGILKGTLKHTEDSKIKTHADL